MNNPETLITSPQYSRLASVSTGTIKLHLLRSFKKSESSSISQLQSYSRTSESYTPYAYFTLLQKKSHVELKISLSNCDCSCCSCPGHSRTSPCNNSCISAQQTRWIECKLQFSFPCNRGDSWGVERCDRNALITMYPAACLSGSTD